MKINKWQNNIAKWAYQIDDICRSFPFGPITHYRNEEGRLHRDSGPALISPTRCIWFQNGRRHGLDVDIFGSKSYYYENILVPPIFFEDPDSISFDWLFKQPNTEVRYVGIKILGVEKAHEAGLLDLIDSDDQDRQLYRCDTLSPEKNSKDATNMRFCVVKVVNSTPEPDGSYRNYYLTVPPDIKTCLEAVAWTFGKTPKEYYPEQET